MFKNLSTVVLGLISALSVSPGFAQGADSISGPAGHSSGASGSPSGTSGGLFDTSAGPSGASGGTFGVSAGPFGPSTSVRGSEPTGNRAIYEMVYQTLAGQGVPGYAIAIVKDGGVVFRATFGMADIEAKKKVNKDTVFGLASLTKTFTGLALLHLVDEGKVKPEATLDQYLKDLPPRWQKLTIFQLASMRAGLPESRPDELPWPEEIAYLKKQPLAYQPDTTCFYSNPSFRILGSVIEAVTGMPYLDNINSVILTPLGMSSSGTTQTMAASGRVSCQYVDRQGEPMLIQPINPLTSFSAGMLASSLVDMCTYAEALLDKKLLSKVAYQTYLIDRPPLPTGDVANWAYGWTSKIDKQLNQRVIIMNGGLPGAASTVILVPDSKMAVVALSNMRTPQVFAIPKRVLYMYLTGDDIVQTNQQPGADSGQRQSPGADAGQRQVPNADAGQRQNPDADGRDSSNPSGGL